MIAYSRYALQQWTASYMWQNSWIHLWLLSAGKGDDVADKYNVDLGILLAYFFVIKTLN